MSMPSPNIVCRIGITCDFETVLDRRGVRGGRFFCPAPYVEAVSRAGGLPVLVPHLSPELAEAWLDQLDGLIIAGGDFDVPPSFYGADPSPKLRQLLETRSVFERSLTTEALRRDLPLLGVCGGMQLLNVVAGGDLWQDLSERPDTGVHEQPQPRHQPQHPVSIAADSLLAKTCGQRSLEVNSTHHQIIHHVGTSAVPTAVAPDGVIEAIELPQQYFAVGVQWHPELLPRPVQQAIYNALVAAAANRASRVPDARPSPSAQDSGV